MNFHVKCDACGATWWCAGSYEGDTNATILDNSIVHEGECNCGETVTILKAEYEDDE